MTNPGAIHSKQVSDSGIALDALRNELCVGGYPVSSRLVCGVWIKIRAYRFPHFLLVLRKYRLSHRKLDFLGDEPQETDDDTLGLWILFDSLNEARKGLVHADRHPCYEIGSLSHG